MTEKRQKELRILALQRQIDMMPAKLSDEQKEKVKEAVEIINSLKEEINDRK